MKEYSISLHNGRTLDRDHNTRAEEAVKNQPHIHPELTPYNVTLKDERIQDAYERIFGDAVKQYNDNQPDKRRKVKNYHTKMIQDGKKAPCYEQILQIGNKDHQPTREQAIKVYTQYYEEFQKKYPSMETIGAYIHVDEDGGYHFHHDYIPVGHYTSGQRIRNSLSRALSEIGYKAPKTKGKGEPGGLALTQWQRDQRKLFREICHEHGIKTMEDKECHRKHLSTEVYKITKDLEHAQDALERTQDMHNHVSEEVTKSKLELNDLQGELATALGAKTKANEMLAGCDEVKLGFPRKKGRFIPDDQYPQLETRIAALEYEKAKLLEQLAAGKEDAKRAWSMVDHYSKAVDNRDAIIRDLITGSITQEQVQQLSRALGIDSHDIKIDRLDDEHER